MAIYIPQVPLELERLYSYTYNVSKTAPPSFPTGRAPKWLSSSRAYLYKTTWAPNARREVAICLRVSHNHTRNYLFRTEKHIKNPHMAEDYSQPAFNSQGTSPQARASLMIAFREVCLSNLTITKFKSHFHYHQSHVFHSTWNYHLWIFLIQFHHIFRSRSIL